MPCMIIKYWNIFFLKGTIFFRLYCSSTIAHPAPDGFEKAYPPKIHNIVEEIAKLTLIEVADLNECLKVEWIFMVLGLTCKIEMSFLYQFQCDKYKTIRVFI